ncbi:maltotransferase domain-containing protein, partial [Streptomyces sp. NPDC046805]|uniref:maltotransferase domain-containing protein n=1 Tax=Streptomyces sp. NPDC046805 TaxID=3155134 RepID=UPI0033C9FCFD
MPATHQSPAPPTDSSPAPPAGGPPAPVPPGGNGRTRHRASDDTATPTVTGRIPVLDVRPVVQRGARPAKAVTGESFEVSATVFREGHDAVAANVVLRDPRGRPGPWTPMRELAPGTDRWGATVTAGEPGLWTYSVEAWGDPVTTWRHHARIKIPAGIDTDLVLEEGARLYERAADRVPEEDGQRDVVLGAVTALRDGDRPAAWRLAAALAPEVDEVLARHPLREPVTASEALPLLVERERALFGSWYEFFPRSEGSAERPHGTLRSAARRLEAIAGMGFDVVYLPPIHPIGTAFRKGRNNTLHARPDDVGVPWAIGS